MNGASPAVQEIITELAQAVRRDHRRRVRRRKMIRVGGVFREVETVTPVSEVQLPQHVTIQAVDSFPQFVGRASPSGFITRTADARWGRFFYHVTGGEARELGCAGSTVPTNNVYITSRRALSEQEILALLEPDGQLKPMVLPGGDANPGTGRPPWITSTSDGCPNPGVAGQPGAAGEKPDAVKAAVRTPPSASTKVLIRTRELVPLGPSERPVLTSGAPAGTSRTTRTK